MYLTVKGIHLNLIYLSLCHFKIPAVYTADIIHLELCAILKILSSDHFEAFQ